MRMTAVITILLAVGACQSARDDRGPVDTVLKSPSASGAYEPPEPAIRSQPLQPLYDQTGRKSFNGAVERGTGRFVSRRTPAIIKRATKSGDPAYQLNLHDAPIASAAKHVLGDILGLNYTLDSGLSGSITLQTSTAVDKDMLIDIFEAALLANGATIVQSGDRVQIVPIDKALVGTPAISVPGAAADGPGIRIQVIELSNISAEEMRTILQPISRSGSILRVDSARNYIMIAGTGADLAAMRDAIALFDVDWMQGMSVALHPLTASVPSEVAGELETIFGARDGPGSKIIRFIPNERLQSVLIITSLPHYLERAAVWIERLDQLADTNEQRLFVYEIQNRPADEMAEVLKSVLQSGAAASNAQPVSPDLTTTELVRKAAEPKTETTPQPSPSIRPEADPAFSIVADVDSNALLISTTARDYQRIEHILRQLDRLPTQLLLEAVIAEVTLTDELKFGVRWFLESGQFTAKFTDIAGGSISPSFPGLGWTQTASDVQVTLSALSSITDVKVVSSPNLMALSNQKAVLQIGDQVPIVTQTAASVDDANAPVINRVELKDTGVILSMTPRVYRSGRVLLDIEQEVSGVAKTTSSGIDSPTIQQRKLATRVIVSDGEALTLGGLIQETGTIERSQVPIIGEIPVLGNLFKDKSDTIRRTELIIFIRPRIVSTMHEAKAVTEEFRRRLDFNPMPPGARMQSDLHRMK